MKEKQINIKKHQRLLLECSRWLGVSLYELYDLQFNIAVDYMNRLEISDSILNAFLREKLFWGWWRNQWALIDEAFLREMKRNCPADANQIRDYYIYIHTNIDVYPDKIIWERIHDSYDRMAQKVIRKELS